MLTHLDEFRKRGLVTQIATVACEAGLRGQQLMRTGLHVEVPDCRRGLCRAIRHTRRQCQPRVLHLPQVLLQKQKLFFFGQRRQNGGHQCEGLTGGGIKRGNCRTRILLTHINIPQHRLCAAGFCHHAAFLLQRPDRRLYSRSSGHIVSRHQGHLADVQQALRRVRVIGAEGATCQTKRLLKIHAGHIQSPQRGAVHADGTKRINGGMGGIIERRAQSCGRLFGQGQGAFQLVIQIQRIGQLHLILQHVRMFVSQSPSGPFQDRLQHRAGRRRISHAQRDAGSRRIRLNGGQIHGAAFTEIDAGRLLNQTPSGGDLLPGDQRLTITHHRTCRIGGGGTGHTPGNLQRAGESGLRLAILCSLRVQSSQMRIAACRGKMVFPMSRQTQLQGMIKVVGRRFVMRQIQQRQPDVASDFGLKLPLCLAKSTGRLQRQRGGSQGFGRLPQRQQSIGQIVTGLGCFKMRFSQQIHQHGLRPAALFHRDTSVTGRCQHTTQRKPRRGRRRTVSPQFGVEDLQRLANVLQRFLVLTVQVLLQSLIKAGIGSRQFVEQFARVANLSHTVFRNPAGLATGDPNQRLIALRAERVHHGSFGQRCRDQVVRTNAGVVGNNLQGKELGFRRSLLPSGQHPLQPVFGRHTIQWSVFTGHLSPHLLTHAGPCLNDELVQTHLRVPAIQRPQALDCGSRVGMINARYGSLNSHGIQQMCGGQLRFAGPLRGFCQQPMSGRDIQIVGRSLLPPHRQNTFKLCVCGLDVALLQRQPAQILAWEGRRQRLLTGGLLHNRDSFCEPFCGLLQLSGFCLRVAEVTQRRRQSKRTRLILPALNRHGFFGKLPCGGKIVCPRRKSGQTVQRVNHQRMFRVHNLAIDRQ